MLFFRILFRGFCKKGLTDTYCENLRFGHYPGGTLFSPGSQKVTTLSAIFKTCQIQVQTAKLAASVRKRARSEAESGADGARGATGYRADTQPAHRSQPTQVRTSNY